MVLFQTNPFFIVIMAYCINKEPIFRLDFAAMALCFAGVFLVASSKTAEDSNTEGDKTSSSLKRIIGIAMVLTTAITYSASSVLGRTLKGINFAVILLY